MTKILIGLIATLTALSSQSQVDPNLYLVINSKSLFQSNTETYIRMEFTAFGIVESNLYGVMFSFNMQDFFVDSLFYGQHSNAMDLSFQWPTNHFYLKLINIPTQNKETIPLKFYRGNTP